MVIFGGLEFVAAGYVLHELGKDQNKARDVAERRRRRRHHHRHEGDQQHRPRPPHHSQHSLAPPLMAPPRPNSAPPVQYSRPGPHQGPWQNTRPNQHSVPLQRPPNVQTWPQRPNPQLHHNTAPVYRPQDPHAQRPPSQQAPPPYQQHAATQPPGPGHLQSRPTMHYDMKTGKWQSDMLPPDMPRANSMPTDNKEDPNRARSNSFQPPPASALRRGHRAYSTGSWSSSDSESDSEDDNDLAYGRLAGRRPQQHQQSQHATGPPGQVQELLAPSPQTTHKIVSHERERPRPTPQPQYSQAQELHGQPRRVELPVEHDWYAGGQQGQKRRQGQGGSGPFEMEQPVRYELP